MLICTPPDVIQRQHLMRELVAAGVVIDQMHGCVRLFGKHGNIVLIHDLLALKGRDLARLCSDKATTA